MEANELIRTTREEAGLTQAALARRAGTSQAGVARLERQGSNPRIATVDRMLRAMGRRLELDAAEQRSSVDETLIAANLRMTPAERLRAFESAHNSLARLRELAGVPAVPRG